MLTIPTVKQAILAGDWFATVDLKDFYFQIRIWEGHRRFCLTAPPHLQVYGCSFGVPTRGSQDIDLPQRLVDMGTDRGAVSLPCAGVAGKRRSMHPVQCCLLRLGLCPEKHRQALVRVTRKLCVALRWWKAPASISHGSMLGPVLRRQVVSTDASLYRWSAIHNGKHTSGAWSVYWKGQYINFLVCCKTARLPHACENRKHSGSGICQQAGGLRLPTPMQDAHRLWT